MRGGNENVFHATARGIRFVKALQADKSYSCRPRHRAMTGGMTEGRVIPLNR